MKCGDVVKHIKTGREGMIVWKKNNQEIGLNFEHYSLFRYGMKVPVDLILDKLRGLGVDDIYSKEQLVKL